YLTTFTLPAQLRPFVWAHQKWAYQAMFIAAKETLDEFFKNDKKQGLHDKIPSLLIINNSLNKQG
ncbi:MAG: hypothetical protein GY823_08520, partial [Flavobacteriaceae bacterium]|nr:hypothetical protein [Flavobacteriaceae bacterium]